jgi:hypothetical protein
MVELLTGPEIFQRLGMPPNPDLQASMESGMKGSQLYYEGVLNTQFTKGSSVDVFNIRVSQFWDTLPSGLARLRLKMGFMRGDPVLSIVMAENYVDMRAGVVTDILADAEVDPVRGIITLPTDTYDEAWIKVSYDYGFERDGDGEFVDEVPPDWLLEAVLSYVPGVLNTQQTTNRAPDAKPLTDESKAHGFEVVRPYLRNNIPFAFLPRL